MTIMDKDNWISIGEASNAALLRCAEGYAMLTLGNLSWERLPNPFPDMESWGAVKRGVSFVVSFDHANPEFGYMASYSRRGDRTIYLDESFHCAEKAKEAVTVAYARSKQ